MFVGKYALQHQNLFTAAMGMVAELAVRRVTYQAGGAGDFLANPVQHHTFHACTGRRDPVILLRRHTGKVAKIGVQAHGLGSLQ